MLGLGSRDNFPWAFNLKAHSQKTRARGSWRLGSSWVGSVEENSTCIQRPTTAKTRNRTAPKANSERELLWSWVGCLRSTNVLCVNIDDYVRIYYDWEMGACLHWCMAISVCSWWPNVKLFWNYLVFLSYLEFLLPCIFLWYFLI